MLTTSFFTLLYITLSAVQPYSGIQHLDQCLFTLSLILMVFNKQPLISHSTLRNQTPYFSLLASACTYLSFWYTCWFAGCNIPAAVAQDSYCTKENFELKFRIKITMHVMPSKLDSSMTNKNNESRPGKFAVILFVAAVLASCLPCNAWVSNHIQRDFLSLNLLIWRTLILYPSCPAPHACLWRNHRARCLRCRFQQ